MRLFKSKKDSLPPLSSLRPPIFDVSLFWFLSLIIALVIVVVTVAAGFWLMYAQDMEDYQNLSSESYQSPINVSRLETVVGQRNLFLDAESQLPRDPSL